MGKVTVSSVNTAARCYPEETSGHKIFRDVVQIGPAQANGTFVCVAMR
jgi:hypothetical protein